MVSLPPVKTHASLDSSNPGTALPFPVTGMTVADTGLGTTFERWALNRYLARLQAEVGLEAVLEGPGDGMTGIAGLNSLILGLQGVKVRLVAGMEEGALGKLQAERAEFTRQVWALHAPQAQLEIAWQSDPARLPAADASMDLAWNFNIMTRLPDPPGMLRELARASRRYVLVFVPNRANYAFPLHRLHHRAAGQPWDHGRVDLMALEPWRKMFSQAGLRVVETVYLDCPWWPDIVDFGQMLADFFPYFSRFGFAAHLTSRARPESRYRWEAAALPYYRPEAHPAVHARMERLAFFEKSRWTWLKSRFAHHIGILGEKG